MWSAVVAAAATVIGAGQVIQRPRCTGKSATAIRCQQEQERLKAQHNAIISQGNNPKALWPGVNNWFGSAHYAIGSGASKPKARGYRATITHGNKTIGPITYKTALVAGRTDYRGIYK